LLTFGTVFLIFLVLFAILGPVIRSSMLAQPGSRDFSAVKDSVGPIFQAPSAKVWLGSDDLGRDICARLAQGARISLFVGFVVQIVSLTLGVTVGMLGIYAPKWIAGPLMRFTDAMFAFPDILLAMLIISVMRNDLFGGALGPYGKAIPVIVALSVTAWPSTARLVRAQAASVKDREYVVAARANGAGTFYLVTRHVLPQLTGILMAVSMIEIAGTILAESTLSFIGIGIQAPDPSWGNMINDYRAQMSSYPGLLIWPCAILSLTVFSLNFVGDGLRSILDPKNK
jgi:ABC-type dipeptide/oligopeptide/nickel transport system permease subunit